jgi:hypothetical protein
MGYSVAPVGDLGACTNTADIGNTGDPGDYYCLNSGPTGNQASVTPDGRPDFIASSHRADFAGMGDVGIAFAIDGATGRVMDVYNHPEPKISSIFAFSNYNQPALGDAGSSNKPDVYQGAMVHDVQHRAQGRGWVLSGDFTSGGANHYGIAVLDDPTPNQIGNFSTSSGGVGDLDGDSRKELMIGAYGPHAPQVIENVVSDVHIFAPLGELVLQTIPDPDQQPGSGFGRGLAPLGDLNDDGFLDFAVGAGGFDPGAPTACSPCTPVPGNPAQGRIYILRSDNSPAPPPEPGPGSSSQGSVGPQGAQGAQGPQSPAATLSGRTLELVAAPVRRSSRRGARVSLRRGRGLRLVGKLESFANEAGCVSRQQVLLQRRGPRSATYRTFTRATTDADGDFSSRFTPRRTFIYRAQVAQTDACLGAVSNREKVRVTRRK